MVRHNFDGDVVKTKDEVPVFISRLRGKLGREAIETVFRLRLSPDLRSAGPLNRETVARQSDLASQPVGLSVVPGFDPDPVDRLYQGRGTGFGQRRRHPDSGFRDPIARLSRLRRQCCRTRPAAGRACSLPARAGRRFRLGLAVFDRRPDRGAVGPAAAFRLQSADLRRAGRRAVHAAEYRHTDRTDQGGGPLRERGRARRAAPGGALPRRAQRRNLRGPRRRTRRPPAGSCHLRRAADFLCHPRHAGLRRLDPARPPSAG